MPNKCLTCGKQINKTALKIACSDCSQFYHGECVNMTKDDISTLSEVGQSWRCLPCSKIRRKTLEGIPNQDEQNVIVDLLNEIRAQFFEKMNELEKNLGSSIELLHSKLNDTNNELIKQNDKISECLTSIDELKNENLSLKSRLLSLEDIVDETEQSTLSKTVVIYGIPRKPTFEPLVIVEKILHALDIPVKNDSIDNCYWPPDKKIENTVNPAPIVVTFSRRIDRDLFLQKRKIKRNLSTRHLVGFDDDSSIFISEALTKKRRSIYSQARKIKSSLNFNYLWTLNGSILMRKENNSKVFKIKCLEDLENLK